MTRARGTLPGLPEDRSAQRPYPGQGVALTRKTGFTTPKLAAAAAQSQNRSGVRLFGLR